MNLLPQDKFNILVHLPPWDVCRRLVENVSETSFWNFIFPGGKTFRGEVQELNFKIYRNVSYRNRGSSILHGELEEIKGGTKIKVIMKLPKTAYVILLILFVVQIYMLFNDPDSYLYGIFILIVGGILYLGFIFESVSAKSAFIELFQKELSAANKDAGPDR